MLSADVPFASFIGEIATPGPTNRIPISLSPVDFAIPAGTALLQFRLTRADGSSLDPDPVAILDSNNSPVAATKIIDDLDGGAATYVAAELPMHPTPSSSKGNQIPPAAIDLKSP